MPLLCKSQPSEISFIFKEVQVWFEMNDLQTRSGEKSDKKHCN